MVLPSLMLMTMSQDKNCIETIPIDEGLLFEDNGYGDEIATWIEDQRGFQQLQHQHGQVKQQRGACGKDCGILMMPNDDDVIPPNADKAESMLEMTLSVLQSFVVSAKNYSAKRMKWSHASSQSAVPQTSSFSDRRSPSRRKMDNALQEPLNLK